MNTSPPLLSPELMLGDLPGAMPVLAPSAAQEIAPSAAQEAPKPQSDDTRCEELAAVVQSFRRAPTYALTTDGKGFRFTSVKRKNPLWQPDEPEAHSPSSSSDEDEEVETYL